MKVVFLLLESIFYVVSIICVGENLLGYKAKKELCFFCCSILYTLLIVVFHFVEYTSFLLIYYLIQILQFFLIRWSTPNSKIIYILTTYALMFCSNIILIMTFACIFFPSENSLEIIELIFHTITFISFLLCCYHKKLSFKIAQILTVLPTGIKILTVISFAISAWVMSMNLANPALNENNSWSITMRISLVLLSLFVCTTVPVLLITVLTNSHLKKQNEYFERELQAQAEHYTALAKSNYELRRFRHDFGNIRIGITKSLYDNDRQTALEMLESGVHSLFDATGGILPFDTGNGIVDAILSEKQAKAKEHHIVIRFDGSVPPSALAPIDLCVIFGNTLDNALDACQKLPDESEKVISISSQCRQGFIFITIENPTSEPVTIKNNMIQTTKNDRVLHGFGLYSLNKTIKKYDGELKLSSEDHRFRVNIDMNLQPSSAAS